MNDNTTLSRLNFVLAIMVILSVVFALWDISRTHDLRQVQGNLQTEMQALQYNSQKAAALLNDVIAYNATVKSPELAQIIQAAQNPQPQPQPAAK